MFAALGTTVVCVLEPAFWDSGRGDPWRSRRLPSSLVAGEALQSYGLTRNPRGIANAVVGATFLASGIGSLVEDGDLTAPTIFVGVGILLVAHAAQIILRWPTRITVRDDGLVFSALTHERLVPWAAIESVRVSHGRYGGGIRWTLARRPHITTAATFENLHRLLVEVERRAPQALVSP